MNKIKQKIFTFFREIVKGVIEEREKRNLSMYSDLAMLILDCKTGRLSIQTIDFLSRMDINPEEFNK